MFLVQELHRAIRAAASHGRKGGPGAAKMFREGGGADGMLCINWSVLSCVRGTYLSGVLEIRFPIVHPRLGKAARIGNRHEGRV